MDEFPVAKTIPELQAEIEESYREQGYALDGSQNIQEYLGIPDEMFAKMDGYGVTDNQTLDKLIALYNVERQRFRSFQPGIYGAYVLMYGGLTPDELAGILGVAIDRVASLDLAVVDDPLERILNDDSGPPGDIDDKP